MVGSQVRRIKTHLLPLLALSGVLPTAPGCLVEAAEEAEVASSQAAITDGVPDPGHPSVGQLKAGPALCTATLVGRRTALTAAHCVDSGASSTLILLDRSYRVEAAIVHPGWDRLDLANDIAVLRLAEEPDAPAAPLDWGPPSPGMSLVLVGFGISGDEMKDPFVKRSAVNQVADLSATRFTVEGSGGGLGSICHGDSGGPAFASAEAGQAVLGVASAGLTPCGTLAYYTRVDAYPAWLLEASDGDLSTPPADLGPGGALSGGAQGTDDQAPGCQLAPVSGSAPLGASGCLWGIVAALLAGACLKRRAAGGGERRLPGVSPWRGR